MFGYVVANKAELKIREYEVYQSYYCGLCKCLKERGGNFSRMSLSYDMTFIYMLLSGLYEPEEKTEPCKCVLHPLEKRTMRKNEIADYVADMSILMMYYKCQDDWDDERKISRKAMMGALGGKYRAVSGRYKEKIERIRELMEELRKGEEENSADIDAMSGLFGMIMAELLVYREDDWAPILSRMGFFLGKFIYILDAYDDMEEDKKKGRYNPLYKLYETVDFEGDCRQILTMMIAECSREFEKLPILQNIEILRNILYSGVWGRYESVSAARQEKMKNAESKGVGNE